MNIEQRVIIATDGACKGNPGPGGYAALLVLGERSRLVSGFAPDTTNNRMELAAVIEGLSALKRPCAVQVISDSKYVIDGITKWIHGWRRNNWVKKGGLPVLNSDLWKALHGVATKHQIEWMWVRGHSGHALNERVDAEAVRMAEIAELKDEVTLYCREERKAGITEKFAYGTEPYSPT